MKKTEDGKYQRFITMLKLLSMNVSLVEALEQMPGYAKFVKDLVTKKRLVMFEDDRRMQHCRLLLQDLSYKRKKIRVRSLFLVESGHYILRKHYVI